ncbi:MAG: pyridoxine 5'-phosphate synthase [Deltaproteobacteria bacterium GWC2_65_14]|nr:MAG: pyridoxine 5'-phosphate synthase [Deltaproteobacteria bacterium GWC2_65_14]
MRKRLGVNIDHVATLRQARRGREPDPAAAAVIAELHGADGITIHLREDRRHIQDRDLAILKEVVRTRINLEMAATEEMLGIAARLAPFSATLVPEKREEVTTEGGLDVLGQREALHGAVSRLREAGILVSLFIDPDLAQVRASKQAGADAVEIHTGSFCEAFRTGRYEEELGKIRTAAAQASNVGLKVFAGHGLDLRNIVPVLSIPAIEEFNIGHSIISRAVFVGLGPAVREMADRIHAAGTDR